jgi:hypothetical protein
VARFSQTRQVTGSGGLVRRNGMGASGHARPGDRQPQERAAPAVERPGLYFAENRYTVVDL